MSAKPLKPTVINEIPFPGSNQEVGSGGISDTQSTYYPTNITPMTFPEITTATQIVTPSLNTVTRTINSNYTFQPLGAISIGTLRGQGTGLSGTGIRISPLGIYGYNAGVETFAIKATDGSFTTTGYIKVTKGADDVNANSTVILPGKIQISGSTTLSDWRGTDQTTIDGGKIYTGSITATEISASYVYAGTLTAGQVNAVAINADSITVGTLTGRTVQSGLGTDRIVLNNGNYLEFYQGNVLRGKIRPGIGGYGMIAEVGSYVTKREEGFYSSSSTSTFTDFSKFVSRNISPYGNITTIEMLANNKFGIFNNGANTALFTVNASGDTYSERRYSSNADNIGFASNLKLTIHADAEVDERVVTDLVSGSYPRIYFPDRNGENSGKKGIQFGNGENFAINNGSTIKNCIIKTKDFGNRALACIESPEVWFMDFTGKDKKLDPIFEAVTEGECEWVKTERGYQVWRRRINLSQIRFEEKTEAQFIQNEKFLSIPHQKD